jgi:hypothetical protein
MVSRRKCDIKISIDAPNSRQLLLKPDQRVDCQQVRPVSTELKHLLYHQICHEFEDATREIEENLRRYVELLLKVQQSQTWHITIAVQGQDTKDPSLKDFDSLEKAGLVESHLNFTHRNIERSFVLSEKGKKVVDKIKAEKT